MSASPEYRPDPQDGFDKQDELLNELRHHRLLDDILEQDDTEEPYFPGDYEPQDDFDVEGYYPADYCDDPTDLYGGDYMEDQPEWM